MGSNSINIGWNKYEVVLLIEGYFKYQNTDSTRKEVISELSKRLRARMINLGMSISDTYRNENGIDLQMRAMEYVLTNGEHGMNHPPKIFVEIGILYANDKDKYNNILSIANIMFPEVANIEAKSSNTDNVETPKALQVDTKSKDITPPCHTLLCLKMMTCMYQKNY